MFMLVQGLPLQVLITIVKADFERNVTFETLPVFVATLTTTGISFIAYSKMPLFKQIWRHVLLDWATERTEEENKIKEDYARKSLVFVYFILVAMMIVLCIVCIVLIFLSQILDVLHPLNETRSHIYPTPDMKMLDNEDQKYFYPNMFRLIVTCVIYMFLGETIFISFICLVTQTYGMFEILNYRLENAISSNRLTLDISKTKYMDAIYKRSLSICLQRHHNVLEFADLMHKYYSPIFTLTLTGVLFTFVLTFYQLANQKLLQFKTIIQFLLTIFLLFFACLSGQKLVDLSSEVGEKAYNGQWYYCSPKVRKLIILIMRRGNIPCRIDGYNLFVASLDCFLRVLQTSFSYCMAMKNIS
ncbi:odorant receptor 13a-like [Prorops nasuta]|uniref:odorant receptor 13a-like n=1 Tax=Prorops nasuta TaxID=863751 RepID=UPI0034CEFFD3